MRSLLVRNRIAVVMYIVDSRSTEQTYSCPQSFCMYLTSIAYIVIGFTVTIQVAPPSTRLTVLFPALRAAGSGLCEALLLKRGLSKMV